MTRFGKKLLIFAVRKFGKGTNRVPRPSYVFSKNHQPRFSDPIQWSLLDKFLFVFSFLKGDLGTY